MLVIKDSMVIIHLAKTTLLELSCTYFGKVLIPPLVQDEVVQNEHSETPLIRKMIQRRKIIVEAVKDKSLIHRANQFNIQRGEAEVVALYWEKNADLIATDDDNVRKKKDALQLKVIGTPAIILELYKKKYIDNKKLQEVIKVMRGISWFSNTIWDKIGMEANKNE
ncbi:hypothetical protein HYU22_04410 [Candidatus Woesearchaeota archaeon]|nr:hypothetical protein [Candidatus Woesearchaeota archaeon]